MSSSKRAQTLNYWISQAPATYESKITHNTPSAGYALTNTAAEEAA